MSLAASPVPRLSTLLRLGRISNVPTVWTNVIAGSFIAGGRLPADRIIAVLVAMSAFYIGGMYLNDFFDRAIDAADIAADEQQITNPDVADVVGRRCR